MIARRVLLASAALAGCAPRLVPLDGASSSEAQALLAASARAHGSLAGIGEVRVEYAGQFDSLVDRLQPELVDAGYRSTARDQLDLRTDLYKQTQTGPSGTKQVERTKDTVRVLFNGTEATDRPRRDAAALVADCYRLFLLGPLLLTGPWATERSLTLALASPEQITVGGQTQDCDVVRVTMRPGLGLSENDELGLYIDRSERLMRRVRFTLNGHMPTRGAIAETDCWAHFTQDGVRWAAQYEERLLRPLPLHVHEWRMTALAVMRI